MSPMSPGKKVKQKGIFYLPVLKPEDMDGLAVAKLEQFRYFSSRFNHCKVVLFLSPEKMEENKDQFQCFIEYLKKTFKARIIIKWLGEGEKPRWLDEVA